MDILIPVSVSVERTGMALDDFQRRQDEREFELIEGEMIALSPKLFGSDWYHAIIHERLLEHIKRGDLGYTYVETTFALPESAEVNWVTGSRQPDVLFIAKTRMDMYRANTPDWKDKPLMLIPDLVVEVVSKTDKLPTVWKKAALYLEDGVRLVWVVNPFRKAVTVFAEDDPPITVEEDGVISGGAVLPGFTLALRDFFAD